MTHNIRRRPVATGPTPAFKKGEFMEYRSTNTFHVGQHENLQIYYDDIVEFDGYTLRLGHDEYPAMNLRGAVRSKWLVPVSDTTTVYEPRSAGVVMAPADTTKSKESHVVGGASMSSDERVMGSTQRVRQRAAGGGRQVQASVGRVGRDVVTVDAGIEVGRVNVPAEAPRRELTRSNAHMASQMAMNQAANPHARATLDINPEALREIVSAEANTAGMSDEELEEWEAKQERRRLATLQAEAEREARRAKFEAEGGSLPLSEQDKRQARMNQAALAQRRATYSGAGAVPFDEANMEETSHALHAMEQPGTPQPMTAQVGTVSGGPSPALPSRIMRTSVGVDWELGRPSHIRMKDAMERYGWSKDILRAIAEVEEDDVARFLANQAGIEAPAKTQASPAPAQKVAPKRVASKKAPRVVPDQVDESEEDPDMDEMDAELAGSGDADLQEGEVITSSGISWNLQDPPHWAARVKKAVLEFGTGIEDLESIAEVEIPAVAKRLLQHVEKLRAEAE